MSFMTVMTNLVITNWWPKYSGLPWRPLISLGTLCQSLYDWSVYWIICTTKLHSMIYMIYGETCVNQTQGLFNLFGFVRKCEIDWKYA